MNDFKFGLAKDVAEVVHALSRIYGRVFDAAFVQWLNECPYGANQWHVVRKAGEVVGTLGMLPCVMEIKGVAYRGMLANNGGIVKKHRGSGLFTDLGMFALKEINGMPAVGASNDTALKGHLAAGWSKAGELELLSGKMPVDSKVMEGEPNPGLRFAHSDAWRRWRYKKPDQMYNLYRGAFPTTHDLKIASNVCKRYEDRWQVMESSEYRYVGIDGYIDIWRMVGTVAFEALKNVGFKSLFTRHLIVHGKAAGLDGEYRMDLCDNDTF